MSVHPSDITSSVSEMRFSEAKKLNGIKNNKAPMSIEANVLQVGEYIGNKQGMSKCLKGRKSIYLRQNTKKLA
jgi:hypothetical protein